MGHSRSEPRSALARALCNERLFIALQALVLILILFQSATLHFPGTRKALDGAPDFMAIYTAGQLTIEGRAAEAYDPATFVPHIARVTDMAATTPWAYPPPAFLFSAPFALLPLGLSFLLFVSGGFLLFCHLLKRLAGDFAPGALAFVMPAAVVCALAGQNGFWTASALCWFALALRGGKSRDEGAGTPLGLLVMKPHLALGIGLLALVTRRWALLVRAALVVGAAFALATILLGPGIWAAFAHGMTVTGKMLSLGKFPLSRMISPFSFFFHLAPSQQAALALHMLVATAACAFIAWQALRRPGDHRTLAAAIGAGLMISPYVYDYDLIGLAAAIALVLPALARAVSGRHLFAMLAMGWLASANSEVAILRSLGWSLLRPGVRPWPIIPLSFCALLVLGVWIWLVLARSDRPERAGATVPV